MHKVINNAFYEKYQAVLLTANRHEKKIKFRLSSSINSRGDPCLQVSYLGVDTLMNRCPPLVKDLYYDSEDLILPYTEAAAAYKKKTYRGSVANMT